MKLKFLKKEWWAYDKKFHFGFCAVLAMLIPMFVYAGLGLSLLESLLIGYFVVTNIGWLKELRDSTGLGTHDMNDMDADMLGTYTGLTLAAILIGLLA